MDISIHGQGLTLTEQLQEYAENKASKLARYLPNLTLIRVDLAEQHNKRGGDYVIAQITVRHSRGALIRAEERVIKEDYNSIKLAINGAVDKMHRRINRFKDKKRSKRIKERERYQLTPEEIILAEPLPDEFDVPIADESDYEDDEGERSPIIRRKDVAVIAMDEDEAIEQMELLGHGFFMFFNPATSSINVVYKREMGGYGLLVPHLE